MLVFSMYSVVFIHASSIGRGEAWIGYSSALSSCPECRALGIEIRFTRQPTFQYPPHLVGAHSLSLSPSLPFLSFSSSTATSSSHTLSRFLISPFFCLGLAFLFVRDSPSAGLEYPDWARLPPPSIPYSSSLSPAHTSSNTTISHQFNRFFVPFPS